MIVPRRKFLGTLPMLAVAPQLLAAEAGLVQSIEKVVLRQGRTGPGPTWFHPRGCMVPMNGKPTAFFTLQTIAGSDYFGPVHWMTTHDMGKTWSEPAPVPSLGRIPRDGGVSEGVCDVVPEYHAPTKSVLALGHVVFYKQGRFYKEQPARYPLYSVYRDGAWGDRMKLEWDDPRGANIYTNNCGQRVVLPDGNILFVMSFGKTQNARSAAGVICSFDGKKLSISKVGREIKHGVGRGLLEPSTTTHQGKYFLTLRAEDNRGYVCASEDGLDWSEKKPWAWEDGTPLDMSTTQQHWLAHSDGLHLVYTRKDASNTNVVRWRSPLFIAQVDPQKLCLVRSTEKIVLPITGDGVNRPDDVALMGNFHTMNVSARESWVTDGEILHKKGFKGDLLLGRITWNKPNRLV